VPGHDEVGAIAEQEVFAYRNAFLAQAGDFGDEGERVDHHAVGHHASFAGPEDAAGDEVENEFPLAVHDGVAGVVAALGAHDGIGSVGQVIDDFPFAFVTPLGADKDCICHNDWSGRRLLTRAANRNDCHQAAAGGKNNLST
jgi:hypothetical protein